VGGVSYLWSAEQSIFIGFMTALQATYNKIIQEHPHLTFEY
jgi:hypothetical protein